MRNQEALRRIVNEEVRRNLASPRYTLNEGFWSGLLKLAKYGLGGLGLYKLYQWFTQDPEFSSYYNKDLLKIQPDVTPRDIEKKANDLLSNSSGSSSASTSATTYEVGDNFDKAIQNNLGIPYVYGGNGSNGIDCSAFTKKVYKEAFGIDLPRTGGAQQKVCQDIPLSQIQKGDLVFLKNTSNNRPPGHVTHVGVYVGDGKVAHASAGAHKKTVIVPMNNYWTCAEHFAGVGRPDRTKIQSKVK